MAFLQGSTLFEGAAALFTIKGLFVNKERNFSIDVEKTLSARQVLIKSIRLQQYIKVSLKGD